MWYICSIGAYNTLVIKYLALFFYLIYILKLNYMKKVFCLIVVFLSFSSVSLSCREVKKENYHDDYNDYKPKDSYHLKQWYTGGNLHKATVLEWKNSTNENKLATCGDFMSVVDKSVSTEVLKRRATDLMNCIDEATAGSKYTDSEKVSTIASFCTVIMGY